MDEYLFTNNAKSTLASGISDSDLSLSVQAGEGALFPNPTGSEYFMCTLVDSSGNREIIKVTARSTDTFTIVREQEGTTGRAFSSDDKVELRLTAGYLTAVVNELSGLLAADFVPDADDTYDLGSGSYQWKDIYIDGIAYIDEFDIDGTYKASFPTNSVGASAKIMMGLNTTIAWLYNNAAPPGWSVVSASDAMLAVSGGSVYTSAGSKQGTWTISGLTMDNDSHNHQWYDYRSNLDDRSYDSGGTAQVVGTRGADGHQAIKSTNSESSLEQDYYTDSDSHNHTISANGAWRPSAYVGKLYRLDT